MGLLIFAIIVLIVAGLLVWAVDSIPLAPPVNAFARVLIIIVAALIILQRSGVV